MTIPLFGGLIAHHTPANAWTRVSAVDQDMVSQADQRIDPNTASAAELASLPGIGEKLAERIITYRQEQAAEGAAGRVFRSPEDLDAVRGIGPKTLERLRPYLKLPRDEP